MGQKYNAADTPQVVQLRMRGGDTAEISSKLTVRLNPGGSGWEGLNAWR